MAKKSKKSESVRSKKKEAAGILLVALCAWSIFCFLSYRPEYSPVLYSPPESTSPSGFIGVWFAYIGLSALGLSGYLIPFALLVGSLLMTLRSHERAWPKWSWLAAGLISISGLIEYQDVVLSGSVENLNLGSPGGVIGQMLAIRTLGSWIGHVGATFFFLAVLFLAILQLTDMHPFTPFIFLWEKTKNLWSRRKDIKEEPDPKIERPEKPKRRARKKKTEELFTPPAPKAEPKPAKKPTHKPLLKPKKPIAPPTEDERINVSVNIEPGVDASGYQLPALTILDELPPLSKRTSSENTAEKAKILQDTLEEFGVDGEVTHVVER